MRKSLDLSLLVAASLLVLRCNTAPEDRALGAPPELPSAASMSIPALQEAPAAKQSASGTGTQLHIGMATATTLFWTGVVTVSLAAPVALFEAARHTEPEVLPDSSGYRWEIGHGVFNAVLTAEDDNGRWNWTMTVMSGHNMSGFVWFTGNSSQDGRNGSWTFYRYPDKAPVHSFVYSLTDSTADVRAMVVDKGADNFGSFLHWKVDRHIKSFEVYDAEDKASSQILYNSVTGAGRIEDEKNGNSYCWDTRLALYADIPCSQSPI